MAQGSDKKSGNAGSASSSSHAQAVRMVSLDAAATEAIRIAKLQNARTRASSRPSVDLVTSCGSL